MTSSYTTNSGIEKPATGDQSGTWGATVNTNMDILDTIVSGFLQITAGSTTVNLTTTDGSVTAGMNRAIKYVDGGDLGGNCTVTITPNDQEKLIFVENGLSASRTLIFKQGTGDTFTLQNGKQAIIKSDGAGSGADVAGVYANIQISTLECEGAAAIDGALTAGGGVSVTGNVTATGTVEPAGDTSAADNAAFGYSSVLGAIITGQGSTNDVTLVNDADATVLGIATGTTNVDIVGALTLGTVLAVAEGGTGGGSAGDARTALGLVIGTNVQAYDADILKADTTDTLTVGYAATIHDAGTKSTGTYTPDEADGNMQKAVNGGAHTLAVPANDCTLIIQYTNDGSAGTITTSAFDKVDGDDLTTTSGDDFFFTIINSDSFTSLTVKALQ